MSEKCASRTPIRNFLNASGDITLDSCISSIVAGDAKKRLGSDFTDCAEMTIKSKPNSLQSLQVIH